MTQQLKSVTFRPTGKKACPFDESEWVRPDGATGFMQGPVSVYGDIFTRHDDFEDVEPEPVDLRALACDYLSISTANMEGRPLFNALIDRIEALESRIKTLEGWARDERSLRP